MLLLLNCCCCCSSAAATLLLLLLLLIKGTCSALARARTRDHTIGTSQPATVLARQDLLNQAQPVQRGSILELSADANPQFGRGSTAERPHTSRLSLSTNCSITAPRYRGRLHTLTLLSQQKRVGLTNKIRATFFNPIVTYKGFLANEKLNKGISHTV